MLVLTLVDHGRRDVPDRPAARPTRQLGPLAAVLLVVLRIAQGFGVGGEWGGAVLMAIEHAPPGKRGFYGSWPQIGVPAGLLLANLVFSLFARMPRGSVPRLGLARAVPHQHRCWSSSACSSACGFSRRRPSARCRNQATGRGSRFSKCCAKYPKEVLLAMGARLAENGAFYIYSVFVARVRDAARPHGAEHRPERDPDRVRAPTAR